MSTNEDKLKEQFRSWTGKFTMHLQKNTPATLSRLEELKCDLGYIAKLLFQYSNIRLPQRKKLRKDSNAYRNEVRRIRGKLLSCADEVESLCSKNLYGKQNMLGTHLRLQDSLKENVRNFENLPRFLRENAEYMECLRQLYRLFNAPYIFGPESLLLAVQKELKNCAGKKSVDGDLADLLAAAYAASGIPREVNYESQARRLSRFREPLRKLIPNGDRERLIDYYFRQNQT